MGVSVRDRPAPIPSGALPAAARPPWRRRHPALARVLLYGALAGIGVTAAILLVDQRRLDELDRQQGLVTVLHGAELIRGIDAASALRIVREDVLAKSPGDSVRRQAFLGEAAALDALERYDEAEVAYGRIASTWPRSLPRGALQLPWANMRVRAARPGEALALLDVPGALEGCDPQEVALVRGAANRGLDRARKDASGAGR